MLTVSKGFQRAFTLGIGPAGPNTGIGTANCGMHSPGSHVCVTSELASAVPANPIRKTASNIIPNCKNFVLLNIFFTSSLKRFFT